MNYNLKGTGLEITPELRSYVEKRLAAADKFLGGDPVAHADAELEYDQRRDPSFAEAPKGKGGKYRAEFTVRVSHGLCRAEEWGSTLHEAIDAAAGEIVAELRGAKQKRLHVFRRAALRIKKYMRGLRQKV